MSSKVYELVRAKGCCISGLFYLNQKSKIVKYNDKKYLIIDSRKKKSQQIFDIIKFTKEE